MLSLQAQLNLIHKTLKVHLEIMKTPVTCSDHHCSNLKKTTQMLLQKSTNEKLDLQHYLNEIIFDRISIPNTHILEYLSMVSRNIDDEGQKNINKDKAEIQSFLSIISQLVDDYSFSSLMLCDSMFPYEAPRSSLTGIQYSGFKIIYFLEITENFKFLEKLVTKDFKENQNFFTNLSDTICNYLEARLGEMTIIDENCCRYIRILTKLIELKVISPFYIRQNLEVFEWSDFGIEFNSLFGSLLTMKVLPKTENLLIETVLIPRDPIRDLFNKSNQKELKDSKYLVSSKHYLYVADSTKTIKILLRYFPDESLKFLKHLVNLHYVKSKISLEERISPSFQQFSDNFSVNLLSILLELSSPLVENNSEKILKIHQDHLKYDRSFQKLLGNSIISNKTLVFEDKDIKGTISNYFYCTLFMLRFGWTSLKKLRKFLINHIKKQFNSQIFQLKCDYNNKIIESLDSILLDENRNKKILNFYLLFCELVLKWNQFEGKLPLTEANVSLFYIPEYILKDFAGFITYLIHRDNSSIFGAHMDGPLDKLFTFVTVLISSRDLFPNLKIVNKFIYAFIILFKKKVVLDNSNIFKINTTVKNYLLPHLLIFYSQVEKYQFYGLSGAKLLFRRNVCVFLKKLSQIPTFASQFRTLQNSEDFSKFLNYLLDEITNCFDSGLNFIKKYKEYQDLNKQKMEYIDQLNEAKSLTSLYWDLLNKTLSIILMFSKMELKIMISEVFGKRFAAFLNYFLKTLNGPEYFKIKIDDPVSVNFKPKKALERIIENYASFMENDEFINYIITDSRSFDISYFEKTFKIISKKLVVSTILYDQFTKLINKLRPASKRLVLIERAPSEFFCKLSEQLMTNPVLLPSGLIVDKSSIERHMLTSNLDPYTKVKLSSESIKELPDLRRRIREYLNQEV